MTTNAGPEYFMAQARYLAAQTTEEKIRCMEEMIRAAPHHKSSENMLAKFKGKLAKLKMEAVREKKSKKGGFSNAIKKEGDAQAVMLGFANSGKSALLSAATNARPKISEYPFTTIRPEIGTLDVGGCKIQLIEIPPLSENEGDKEWISIARVSDLVILLVTSLEELMRMSNYLKKETLLNKRLIVLNKIDLLDKAGLDKFKSFPSIIKISAKTGEGLDFFKEKVFEQLSLIRVHTKEPGKKPTENPVILDKGANIRAMALKIRKDYPERLLFAKVWGKSAKFPGQSVGLEHKLEDKDIIELHLK